MYPVLFSTFVSEFASPARESAKKKQSHFPTILFTAILLTIILPQGSTAVNLLTETFDCPPQCVPACLPSCVATSTITPLGCLTNSDLVVANGFLQGVLCNVGDGIRIDFPPSLPTAHEYRLDTLIEYNEFDHAESFIIALNVEEDNQVYRAIKVQFLRDPGWNKCQIMVEYKDKEGNSVKGSVFFGCNQVFNNQGCPGAKQVSFAWVNEDGVDKAKVQVRDENGNIVYSGAAKPLPFSHADGKVVGVEIKKVQPVTLADGSPVPCGTLGNTSGYSPGYDLPPGVVPQTDELSKCQQLREGPACNVFGTPGYTFQVDTIVVESDYVDDGALPPVTLNPSEGGQGETLDVQILTREPMFFGTQILDFGPNIAINSVQILNPQSAILNVTISENAVAYGRVLVIDTGPTMADFGYAVPFFVLDVPPSPTMSNMGMILSLAGVISVAVIFIRRNRFSAQILRSLPVHRVTLLLFTFIFASIYDESEVAANETRCVTVTTRGQAVKYTRRTYTCANADGGGAEIKDVSPQLDGDPAPPHNGWTISANSTETKYFDVPCPEGKVVVAFSTEYFWVGEPFVTIRGGRNTRTNEQGQCVVAPLGTVTSQLACGPGGGLATRDLGAELFACPNDGGSTVICFTPIDDSMCICECFDPVPPVQGIDYELLGNEIETVVQPVPALSQLAVLILASLLIVVGNHVLRSMRWTQIPTN